MLELHVGYYTGKQSTKYWIMCKEDLNARQKPLINKMRRIIFCCDVMDGLLTSDDCSKTPTVSTSWKQKGTEDHPVDKRHDGMDDTDDKSEILDLITLILILAALMGTYD